MSEEMFLGTANAYMWMKTGTWDTPDKNASGEIKAHELLLLDISADPYRRQILQDLISASAAGKASVYAHTFHDSQNILPTGHKSEDRLH